MSDKKYTIIISETAQHMLETHIRFLAQVNKDSAIKKKSEIINAIYSLSRMPQRFPYFEEDYISYNKYHKMCVDKRYLILFQIKDNTVEIDYILDCRQDYSWLIR